MAPEHVAVSDCERVRSGPVAQPANTVSSLALCLGGAWIWARFPRPRRGPWPAVASASFVAGLGSVAYHGPGGPRGRALHDISSAALALVVAGAVAGAGRPTHPELGGVAGICAAAGLAVHRHSRTEGRLCRPDTLLQGHALWHVLIAASVVALAEAYRPTDA